MLSFTYFGWHCRFYQEGSLWTGEVITPNRPELRPLRVCSRCKTHTEAIAILQKFVYDVLENMVYGRLLSELKHSLSPETYSLGLRHREELHASKSKAFFDQVWRR